MLEYMCGHNVDFLWLAEGHRPDHTTLSGFRKESGKALKGLFRQVGRLAMAMGLVRLVEVAFDGTRVKANASRYHTWTAAKVEAALKELDALFDRMMSEADQADAQVQEGLFAGESANHLPAELATLEQRRQKLQEVLQTLQSQDEARQKEGKDPEKNPAQLPKADTDSKVMPNKEGGYAPNFTPTAAVDVSSDLIVDCEVIADPNEHTQTLADRGSDRGELWPEAGGFSGRHGPRHGRESGGHAATERDVLHADGIVAAAGGQSGAAGRSVAAGGGSGLAAVAAQRAEATGQVVLRVRGTVAVLLLSAGPQPGTFAEIHPGKSQRARGGGAGVSLCEVARTVR